MRPITMPATACVQRNIHHLRHLVATARPVSCQHCLLPARCASHQRPSVPHMFYSHYVTVVVTVLSARPVASRHNSQWFSVGLTLRAPTCGLHQRVHGDHHVACQTVVPLPVAFCPSPAFVSPVVVSVSVARCDQPQASAHSEPSCGMPGDQHIAGVVHRYTASDTALWSSVSSFVAPNSTTVSVCVSSQSATDSLA